MSTTTRQAGPPAKAIAPKKKQERKKRHPRPQLPLTRRLYTISEFCLMHRMSRSNFYNLQARDEAPDVMEIGGKRMISEHAIAAWLAKFPLVGR